MNELRQGQSRRILAIAFLATFVGFLDTHLLIPVLALYASGLGASVGATGLIIGLYSIVNTPANILFGRLIDRVGYKLPLVCGLAGDALSMFFYSRCRLPIHLALVRVFHGTSGAVVGPATMSLTAYFSAGTRKGRAMGFYGMSIASAALVGYGLGGVIASRLGHKTLFLTGAVILLAGAVLCLWLPDGKKQDSARVRAPLGEALKQLKDLVKRQGLALAYCSIFAQYFAFSGVVTLLPIYMKGLGMEAFHVGISLASFTMMFMLAQLPSGALSDKMGRLVPASLGLSLGIVSLVTLPLLATFPLLVAAMALWGVAHGILFPSISELDTDHTLPEEHGMATGLFHSLLTAGVAIGAPLMGWVGGVMGIKLGIALSSMVMVLALVMVLRALKR